MTERDLRKRSLGTLPERRNNSRGLGAVRLQNQTLDWQQEDPKETSVSQKHHPRGGDEEGKGIDGDASAALEDDEWGWESPHGEDAGFLQLSEEEEAGGDEGPAAAGKEHEGPSDDPRKGYAGEVNSAQGRELPSRPSWLINAAIFGEKLQQSTKLAPAVVLLTVFALLVTTLGFKAWCFLAVLALFFRLQRAEFELSRTKTNLTEMQREIRKEERRRNRSGSHDVCSSPRTVQSSEGENAFMNAIGANLWEAWLCEWLSNLLRECIQARLAHLKPAIVESVSVGRCQLHKSFPGVSVPQVMRSRNHGSDGSVLLEFAVELGTVQVSMEMSATLSRLELNAEFPAECRFRQMDAYVRLIFAKTPPYIRALRLSLEELPHIEASIWPDILGGMNVADIPGLDEWIKQAIEDALERYLVHPHGFDWDAASWFARRAQSSS